MSFFKADTFRRREVRKTMPRKRGAVSIALARQEVVWGSLLFTLFVTVASLMILDSRSQPPYRPGQLVDQTQLARVAFKSLDQKATDDARRRARESEPPVYVSNERFISNTEQRLRTLPKLAATVSFEKLADDVQKSFALTRESHSLLASYQVEGQPTESWLEKITPLIDALREEVIFLDTERYQIEQQNGARAIRLADTSRLVFDRDLYNVNDDPQVRRALRDYLVGLPDPIRDCIVTYFTRSKEPCYQFNQTSTEQAQKKAAEAVADIQTSYEPNSVLIPAGKVLDADGLKLLQREQTDYLALLPSWQWVFQGAGPVLLLLMIAVSMVVCVMALRPRIIENPMRGLALVGLLLLSLGIAWLSRPISPYLDAAVAVGPAVLVAFILAIAYDQRLAAAISALNASLLCLLLDQSLGLYMVSIIGCLTAASHLREVRRRGLLVRAGFVTGLVVGVGVCIVGFYERQFVPTIDAYIFREALGAFLASVAVGFFVLGTLPFIEQAFKVTTSMTLLELADMDRPLLRRLAQAAPGTFNHSLQVAVLAEAGADAIGANSLLARVGAYYHDIGKMHKPMYFVENQCGGANRHEKLSPAMSLLIIVAHVKDGIEMAREYGLPPALHHFIESHHGTTLVEYFYHAALKAKDDRQQPEEIEFRYPGPKPRTREAAVLMICDAVESACRALPDPTSARIEQLVHKITTKRLMDGQFDECDLTLNDLRKIEESVSRTLTSIYHGRIAYPGDKKNSKGGSEPSASATLPPAKPKELAVG